MPASKVRILIIEDDAVLRRGLAHLFARDDFDVILASDGEEGVESIVNASPDLVLSDYRLPRMDGLGVLGHLKRHGKKTPFILMTAYGSGDVLQQARELGAAAVIEKPFELNDLRSCCRELLTNSEQNINGGKQRS